MTFPPLRDYQKLAVEFVHANPRSGLFLDMGLGKTRICLDALTPDRLPALVVAPKRVVTETWPEERAKWRPDLTLSVATPGTSPSKRMEALQRKADITVMSQDNWKDLAKVKRPQWKTLIIDELSGYKGGHGAVRWRAAKRLVWGRHGQVENVWGLTGTPSPNGLLDLWAQVYLLDKGERLFPTLTEYRSRFFVPGRRLPNGIIANYMLFPGDSEPEQQQETAKRIHTRIEDICLSMGTDGRVELPDRTENEVKVTLPPVAVRAYRELRDELVTNLDIIGGEIHTVKNAAMLTNRLAQLTAGFIYSDDYDLTGVATEVHHAKMDALQEIAEGTGSPLLVGYGYVEERDMILKRFPHARTMDEQGVVADWNKGRVPMLLAHPASAGHGLNLQYGGHTIVWMTLPWSLEWWQQFNKRLHRSGQQNPVVIHKIMAHTPRGGTVDHIKEARLLGKDNVQQALMDHLEAPL